MRFADLDGSMIDVYQATTQMTDESGHGRTRRTSTRCSTARSGRTATTASFTANMHTDDAAARRRRTRSWPRRTARGVPVVSAAQMLDWLDGRNGSSFQRAQLRPAGGCRSAIAPAAGARGLEAMLPARSRGRAAARLDRRRRAGRDDDRARSRASSTPSSRRPPRRTSRPIRPRRSPRRRRRAPRAGVPVGADDGARDATRGASASASPAAGRAGRAGSPSRSATRRQDDRARHRARCGPGSATR